MTTQFEEKIVTFARKVVESTGLGFYDAEYNSRSKTLVVFIYNKETNSAVIEECIIIDRAFTEPVEAADWIPDDFVLEVSSPGVFRKLKTPEHFEKALNLRITVELLQSLKHESKNLNNKKSFKDVYVVSSNENEVEFDINDEIIKIKLDDIKKAKLDPEF